MKKIIFILCVCLISIMGCETEEEPAVYKKSPVEVNTISEPVDITIEENTPEPIIVEPEKFYIITPFPVYRDFYFFTENKSLYKMMEGVIFQVFPEFTIVQEGEDDIVSNFTLSQFYTAGENIYFSTIFEETEIYFIQSPGGIITEVSKQDFGKPYLATYGTYLSQNFELIIEPYDDLPISKLFHLKMGSLVVFRTIYETYENKNGIYFNVIESGIPGKMEGLYYFPINRTSCSKVLTLGRMYD